MTEIVESTYEPRRQFEEFHTRDQRWACLVAHRRAGKTVACINEVIARATYTSKVNARYAYIAPFYRQAKDVAWTYLKEYAEGLTVKVRESSLRVELFNGSWITLYGADNPDALRGLYFDGVILDEYGDCRPSLWGQVVLPTLADRDGWAIFIGTPKGKNHFYQIRERAKTDDKWYYDEIKASDSGILNESTLMEIRAECTEDEYLQEFECSFEAAVVGTYYASLITKLEQEGRIGPNPGVYTPGQQVFVAADLGRSDSTAFWYWQEGPDGPDVIDYDENDGKDLDFYFDLLDSKGYKYDTIWLPHDAKAKTLATKRSTIEQFLSAGYPVRLGAKLAVQHGIDAVRRVLPACRIDTNKCSGGVEALRAYRRAYNEITKAFSERPHHDWASNGADAFRYMALQYEDRNELAPAPQPDAPLLKAPEIQLQPLWDARDKRLSAGRRRRMH